MKRLIGYFLKLPFIIVVFGSIGSAMWYVFTDSFWGPIFSSIFGVILGFVICVALYDVGETIIESESDK